MERASVYRAVLRVSVRPMVGVGECPELTEPIRGINPSPSLGSVLGWEQLSEYVAWPGCGSKSKEAAAAGTQSAMLPAAGALDERSI